MDTHHMDLPPTAAPEPDSARARRLRWEAEQIAEAEAEIAAGNSITGDEWEAWLTAWESGTALPEIQKRA